MRVSWMEWKQSPCDWTFQVEGLMDPDGEDGCLMDHFTNMVISLLSVHVLNCWNNVWNKDIEVFILMCWSACCAALRVLDFCPRLIVPFRSKVQFCVQKTRAWYLFVTGWQELFPHTSWALSDWLIHCSLHRANVWGFPTCAINQSTTW